MEKLLTISVAAYNVASTLGETLSSMCLDAHYMKKLEVIVTDDGSVDGTPQIAQGFVEKHPGTFRLISQENKGYGSSLENALAHGRGLYFKVVDGDDKVDPRGLERLLDRIRELAGYDPDPAGQDDLDRRQGLTGCRAGKGDLPDLILTPFFTWRSEVDFGNGQHSFSSREYKKVENHSGLSPVPVSIEAADLSRGLSIFEITCRRDMLLKVHPKFLHHCFYVDNELVMAVLIGADTLCRMDHPVTVYRTDRPGQSMSQDFLAGHFEDTVRVGRQVFSMYLGDREHLSGGKREASELLVSSMARLEWLAGLLSPHPLRCRGTLRKRYRALRMESPDLFQVTQRSRIARAGRLAGPFGFLVLSASFKIKNRISRPGQVVYFAKKNTSEKE